MLPMTHDLVPTVSVFDEGEREAHRHKWLESEKRGWDVGRWGIEDWYRTHWPRFLRHKRLEHLQGRIRCREFPEHDFGMLRDPQAVQRVARQPELLELVLHRIYDGLANPQLKSGFENLHLVCWAQDRQLPIDSILEILTAINLNETHHLVPHAPGHS